MASQKSAFKLSTRIEGLDAAVGSVEREVALKSERAMRDISIMMIDSLREVLNQPGSGKWYRSRRKDGTMHQASAPGESPAPDRGAYRDSFRRSFYKLHGQVGFSIWSPLWERFGRRLQMGGLFKGVYIAPRPHIDVAFNRIRDRIQNRLENL